ncbi:hypothetical protein [Pseudoxanthomonas wuyuanensis]|uniref:Uncharacterized protein n=1 Tax=Pseudoxanthomonas wuyuanensis TaxID=1073196 RepID=A0A286D5Z2_9GAMM|nr:hypothetical protein [Pseudoxanthomonas wuyuanensis]KAF1721568.1 hypothetical protein CSC75_07200 [Pseudoxanthomonas wuyuanensis]SOD54080.1 hypothetical protein SAMN06296416_10377 [Pseudoxanthomonas wuyuanensis]
MRQAPQGRTAQAFACLTVAVVHIGLFWLLAIKPRYETTGRDISRLRVVFLPRPPPAVPPSPPLPARLPTPPARDRMPARASVDGAPSESAPTPAAAVETAHASAAELAGQAAAWAAQSVPNGFDADPLRSRRAQLPGGERGDRFAMRPPPWACHRFPSRPRRSCACSGQGRTRKWTLVLA